MLDVSVNAMNSGLCVTAIQALKASLQILCEKNNNTRVGFVIMDTRAHFISFRGGCVHDSICGDFTSSFDCVSSQAWLTPVNEETLPNVVDFIQIVMLSLIVLLTSFIPMPQQLLQQPIVS